MDIGFRSRSATMKRNEDGAETRQDNNKVKNKKDNTTAATRWNDDEVENKKDNTTTEARRDDGEVRDERSNTATEEDKSMTSARWHQRTMGKSAEKRWKFSSEWGREVPSDTVLARVERNTEAGTQTNTTSEE